jgi:hypothetical protein
MAGRTRAINDREIALIRAMIRRKFDKTKIQAYFTHPERTVNFGRITNIENEDYGRGIEPSSDDELDKFLTEWGGTPGKERRIYC